jgi:hypothetical protein
MDWRFFVARTPDAISDETLKSGGIMMWYVGQKVRCVNAHFPIQVLDWGSNLPREGEVYTIRLVAPVPSVMTGRISPGFLLEELNNIDDRLFFNPNRFVPLSFFHSFHAKEAARQLRRRRNVQAKQPLSMAERILAAHETIYVTFLEARKFTNYEKKETR